LVHAECGKRPRCGRAREQGPGVVALEYLLSAVDLIIEVRGSSIELDALRRRTKQVLDRSLTDGV
jgi:hypothetical protein